MFKDYYQILEVPPTASASEVKTAYRAMSMKWHPDKNPGKDVMSKMQDINEAYAILKDEVKRQRYDNEYRIFTASRVNQQEWSYTNNTNSSQNANDWDYNYDVHDDSLKDDIKEAREYAKSLVEEFLNSFKTASKDAVKGAWNESKYMVYIAIFFTLLGLFISLTV